MFFSIIIPTYNPKNQIKPLLDSIYSNKCIKDMEVIISDDCSTEPFEDILINYPNLNIKIIKNEEHCGYPSLGKSNGLKAATGKWVCFADQDDYFKEKALDEIKEGIEISRAKNYVITNIIIKYVETGIENPGSGEFEWTHGKIYERAFLTRNHISYDKLKYKEDINFSTKVDCALVKEDISPYFTNNIFYVWCQREDSLSNDDNYHINMLPDYIQATLNIIIKYLVENKDNLKLYKIYRHLFIKYFLYIYFYSQGPLFLQHQEKILEAIILIRPLYKQFIDILSEHNEELLSLVTNQLLDLYNGVREVSFSQKPFIEYISLMNYLNVYFNY